jgi:hypothetical protein
MYSLETLRSLPADAARDAAETGATAPLGKVTVFLIFGSETNAESMGDFNIAQLKNRQIAY